MRLVHLFRCAPIGRTSQQDRDWVQAVFQGRRVATFHHFKSDAVKVRPFTRVAIRDFKSSRLASQWFSGFVQGHLAQGFEQRAPRGFSIHPSGKGAHVTGFGQTGFGRTKPWGSEVVVELIDPAGAIHAEQSVAALNKPDITLLRRLAKSFKVPPEKSSLSDSIDAANTWWSALVSAGLPNAQRDFRYAVRKGKPYSAAEVRAAERSLSAVPLRKFQLRTPLNKRGLRMPRSFVSMLRECGDLSVRGQNFWQSSTVRLPKLKVSSDLLDWEIERHGERGSFTQKQLESRCWLRFAENPGHSFWVMDLRARNSAGECALYRVDDPDLPTAISKKVFGVKAWLRAQLNDLRSEVLRSVKDMG